MKRIKVTYLKKIKGQKRRQRITYYRSKRKSTPSLRTYTTQTADISKTGLRPYLSHKKKTFKRLRGKQQVDIVMKVVGKSGRINRDLKGVKGLILPRNRAAWQKTIGDYIHNQLAEYNLFISHYFSPKVAKQLKMNKARSVKVSFKFKGI